MMPECFLLPRGNSGSKFSLVLGFWFGILVWDSLFWSLVFFNKINSFLWKIFFTII